MSLKLTLTGNLPNNSGSMSSTLTLANDPPAINKILSVLITFGDLSELLAGIAVPSKRGRKSLWTPSVDTPLAVLTALEDIAILSISSIKTIPFYYAFLMLSSSISNVLMYCLILFSYIDANELFNSLIFASITIISPSAYVKKEFLSGWNVPGRIVNCLSSQKPYLTSWSLLYQS